MRHSVYYTKCALLKAGCETLKIHVCNIQKIVWFHSGIQYVSLVIKTRKLKRFMTKKVISFVYTMNELTKKFSRARHGSVHYYKFLRIGPDDAAIWEPYTRRWTTRSFAIAKRTARRSCLVDLVHCQHCFLRHMG